MKSKPPVVTEGKTFYEKLQMALDSGKTDVTEYDLFKVSYGVQVMNPDAIIRIKVVDE